MTSARIRARDLVTAASLLPVRLGPWLRSAVGERNYTVLDERAVRATRRSDTIFVFGSGWSLNELSTAEFGAFEQHDTLGFNWFVRETFVRCDYHLIREIDPNDRDPRAWKPALGAYTGSIRANPNFAKTVFVVQGGLRAIEANRVIGYGLLPKRAQIVRFRTLGGRREPSRSLAHGLARGYATLEESVNFAYILGWRRIVLVGVDLYDRRYFWLDREETREGDVARGASSSDPHAQAHTGLVEQLGEWGRLMGAEGVSLEVYNPRSLLAKVLPVYAGP